MGTKEREQWQRKEHFVHEKQGFVVNHSKFTTESSLSRTTSTILCVYPPFFNVFYKYLTISSPVQWVHIQPGGRQGFEILTQGHWRRTWGNQASITAQNLLNLIICLHQMLTLLTHWCEIQPEIPGKYFSNSPLLLQHVKKHRSILSANKVWYVSSNHYI